MGESWVSPQPSFPLSSEGELVLRVRHSSDALSDTLRVQEKGSVTKDSKGQFSPRMLLEVSKTAGMTLFLITHLSAHCHPTESPIAPTPGLLGNWADSLRAHKPQLSILLPLPHHIIPHGGKASCVYLDKAILL